jgi:hypothetical protein
MNTYYFHASSRKKRSFRLRVSSFAFVYSSAHAYIKTLKEEGEDDDDNDEEENKKKRAQ